MTEMSYMKRIYLKFRWHQTCIHWVQVFQIYLNTVNKEEHFEAICSGEKGIKCSEQ